MKYIILYEDFIGESDRKELELISKYSPIIPSIIFNQLKDIDKSPNKKYLDKICRFFLDTKDHGIVSKLETLIPSFDKLVSKRILKGVESDINKYKTIEELEKKVADNLDSMTKRDEAKLIKTTGTELILKNDKYVVLLIKDMEASIKYGKGTKWCISALDNNAFKDYRGRNNTIYFIFQKHLDSSDPNHKIALSVGSDDKINEVRDSLDKRLPLSIIKELGIDVKLFKPVEQSKEEMLHNILKNCIDGTYKINSKGLIDVDGTVNLINNDDNGRLYSILDIGRFGHVTGNFYCGWQLLKSLEGAPESVYGNFDCESDKLKSLKGAPITVGGNFNCANNYLLTSLEGAPKSVGGNFNCSGNKQLASLKGAPITIGGNFNCGYNNLTSLEGSPETVGGDFNCFNNGPLTSLKGAPKSVGGDFNCSYNNLKSLDGAPKKVGGDFDCRDNDLVSLKGAPEHVGGKIKGFKISK